MTAVKYLRSFDLIPAAVLFFDFSAVFLCCSDFCAWNRIIALAMLYDKFMTVETNSEANTFCVPKNEQESCAIAKMTAQCAL